MPPWLNNFSSYDVNDLFCHLRSEARLLYLEPSPGPVFLSRLISADFVTCLVGVTTLEFLSLCIVTPGPACNFKLFKYKLEETQE